MRKRGIKLTEKRTYNLQGLTCAHCAQKFEQNIRNIDSVEDVVVNFSASKVSVTGDITVQQLEEAGAFENIKVFPERSPLPEKEPFWKKRENKAAIFAFFILIIGLVAHFFVGKDHPVTIGLFIMTMIVGGYDLFKIGIRNLFSFYFDMKTLMTIAIIGAALIGEWVEGAIVVILFAISEALEAYSIDQARQSIQKLISIAPNEATLLKDGQQITVHVDDIDIGDTIVIKPGEKIAMDGIVTEGSTSVNQAAITGESLPVHKSVGDDVFAGTLNEEGAIYVQVTKRVEDTTLAKIIHLVEEAQTKKAPAQKFVDQFAKYYTPSILMLGLLVATLPPILIGADWSKWIYLGLATLVVGCPCALVISTPVAVVTAIGNAAQRGILIKGGAYLEEAGRLRAIAFDKTGTLTVGKPIVTEAASFIDNETELFRIAAAIEQSSQHPIARAILDEAHKRDIEISEIKHFHSKPGKGASAWVEGRYCAIGNEAFFGEHLYLTVEQRKLVNDLREKGRTVMFIQKEQHIIGLIAVSDHIRKEAKSMIEQLKKLNLKRFFMLTGDHEKTAAAFAKDIEIDTVRAELLPEDKVKVIEELRASYGSVAMIGDGVNDAPALASSSLGIAMGTAGTDVALETADIVLMDDDLHKIPETISLSRKTIKIIQQNITFSFGLKVFALLLVIPNLLTLWIAIIADVGATLLVVLNSMRLMKK